MPKLSKPDLAAVRRLRALLDPSDPMFGGPESIRRALSRKELRLYLQTWVLPELERLGRLEGAVVLVQLPAAARVFYDAHAALHPRPRKR